MLTCTSSCHRGKSKASGRLSPQKTALSSQTGANKQIASRAIKPNPEEDLRRDVPCLCPDEADPCEKLMANASVWVATCVTLVRHLNTRSPTRRIKKGFVSPVQSSFLAKSPLVYRKETKKKKQQHKNIPDGWWQLWPATACLKRISKIILNMTSVSKPGSVAGGLGEAHSCKKKKTGELLEISEKFWNFAWVFVGFNKTLRNGDNPNKSNSIL